MEIIKKPVNIEVYGPLVPFETLFVGMARFELATSWSQTRRDDRTTLHPEREGKPSLIKELVLLS